MFTEVLNMAQKYVASRTLKEPLAWMNSTLLSGDAAGPLAKLKLELDRDILIVMMRPPAIPRWPETGAGAGVAVRCDTMLYR